MEFHLSSVPPPSVEIKLRKPLHRILIPEPHQLVLREHVLLRPHILAADAMVLLFLLIVKHINVQVSHKAGGTPVI